MKMTTDVEFVEYDMQNKSRDVRGLEKDMQYSRSRFVTWGKEVISAIDIDHAGRLIFSYKSKKHLGADIDAQVVKSGYGGYSWTVYIHNFLGRLHLFFHNFIHCELIHCEKYFFLSYVGDTALHLALRQKKFVCAHALLLLGARTDIKNDVGVTQEDLILKITGKSLDLFRRETEVSSVVSTCCLNLSHLFLKNLSSENWWLE